MMARRPARPDTSRCRTFCFASASSTGFAAFPVDRWPASFQKLLGAPAVVVDLELSNDGSAQTVTIGGSAAKCSALKVRIVDDSDRPLRVDGDMLIMSAPAAARRIAEELAGKSVHKFKNPVKQHAFDYLMMMAHASQ